jgi:type IV pilus assembly protein PilQ
MLDIITKLARPLRGGVILISITLLMAGCASQNTANVKSAEENKLITDLTTSEDAEAMIVTVKSGQTLTYTAIKQVFPLGVLFHFPETALDNIKEVYYPPENETISSIRATQIEKDGTTSRIFIALKKDLPYNIMPDETGMHISFPKSGQPAAEISSPDAQAQTADKGLEPEPEPELEKKMAPPATRITAIGTTPLKKNIAINIKANGTIKNYKAFTIKETPPRIVYDLYGLKSPYKGEQRIVVKSDWVTRIRHFGHADKVRIVLETKKAYLNKYSATPVDNGLLIYVGQTPKPTPKQEAKPAAAQAPEKESTDAVAANPAAAESTTAAKTTAVKSDQPAWLNRIDFSVEEAGKSALIVGTTRPVKYQLTKITDKRLQLQLLETRLPEYRKRALITTRFQSAVDRITPTQQPKAKETMVLIELREAVPYFVKQTDNVIRVNFSPSKIPPRPYEDAKLPAWKKVLADPAAPPGKKSPAAAAKTTIATAAGQEQIIAKKELGLAKKEMSLADRLSGIAVPGQKYTGEKIALDFFDTDIKNVFRILREISNKNFAIDKNVTGKVTLTLEKPVPWDQVLDLVLKMNKLGVIIEGDIVRIATLNTLAQEEKLRQARAKATQAALKQQKSLEPLVTEYIPINYSNAKTEILPHVKPILTPTRGKVSVDTRNNQLIVTDTADKIAQARQIVDIIDQVTPQVIIEARIVEANTNFSRELGFDWGEITLGDVLSGGNTLDFFGFASNLPATIPSAVVGGSFQKLKGTPFSIIDAKLIASETEGKSNIISSPKVVTLDNKKARIKQGLEVPYLERDSSGNATVRFKNVDLLLEVTPNITPDDRIVMKIFVTKNDVVDPTADQPALSTNEAETELLVDDGDTIVIGGIVKSTITYGEKGIPGLRKLGVLGWLFKSQTTRDQKNELLIFITPRIVKLKQRTTGSAI